MTEPVDVLAGLPGLDRDRLARAAVVLAGVGNIGSPLAGYLAGSGIARLVLIDRDRVEEKNVRTQDFRPEDVGRFKAAVLAERLRGRGPEVEAVVGDIEALPRGLFEADLLLGALDSRRARQMLLSEIAWPMGIPAVDGGVGEGLRGRVQVFVPGPGRACLECGWGGDDYRHLAAEYPCLRGDPAAAPSTVAPAFLGAATAALMASEALKLLGGVFPEHNHEIAFDLFHGRFLPARLRHNARCRFDHQVPPRRLELPTPFDQARVADLLGLVGPGQTVETGRKTPGFNRAGLWGIEELKDRRDEPLGALGLDCRDRLRLRGGSPAWVVLGGGKSCAN